MYRMIWVIPVLYRAYSSVACNDRANSLVWLSVAMLEQLLLLAVHRPNAA
jgi:hypothetical protein